ncbi:MAG: NUDIX hydrolase [Nocardioides sp.]
MAREVRRRPAKASETGDLPDIVAAGAVVFSRGDAKSGPRVLLVHRPRYDDWSFPKGKVDRGEHVLGAGVREVFEETGLRIRLGVPLADQRYWVGRRMKTVHYWIGHTLDGHDIDGYAPNSEIDGLRWVKVAKAPELLTYPFDRRTLRKSLDWREPTNTLLVVRHARARARRGWKHDDVSRPLLKAGVAQANRLVPLFAAYDVRDIVSSSSVRCAQTMAPYADQSSLKVRTRRRLSEDEATPESVAKLVGKLVSGAGPALDDTVRRAAALCSHRPVLPMVFDALGIEPVKLDPGGFVVVHHRGGKVLRTEEHGVR